MTFDFKIKTDKNRDLKIINGIIYKKASLSIPNIQWNLQKDECLEQALKDLKQVLKKRNQRRIWYR